MNRFRFLIAFSALLLQGCGDALGPELHTDIARARADWLANRSPNYSFEVTISSSWFPPRLYSVWVQNFEAVEVIGPTDAPFTERYSIDDIWDRIIEAQNEGELNNVRFDGRGIPVSSDMGPWEVDGGIAFEVKHFTRR